MMYLCIIINHKHKLNRMSNVIKTEKNSFGREVKMIVDDLTITLDAGSEKKPQIVCTCIEELNHLTSKSIEDVMNVLYHRDYFTAEWKINKI